MDPEERWAMVMAGGPARANNSDILRIPLKPAGEPQPFVATAALEFSPEVSPDGRWVAYVSASTGVQEVWVREINGSGQYQISTLGGLSPRWSADGRELFFRRGDVQMAVDIETTPRFRAGQERTLFAGVFNWRTEAGINYAVDNKTDRFLVILPPSSADPEAKPAVRVIANWK